MMLQQEAVERAWACIRSKGARVEGFESVKRLTAASMPQSMRAKADQWVVRFGKKTDPDTVDSVDVVVVQVDDKTGEATIVPGL
jgi:hypothetical protein